ncbi:helix-turn-helix domain-containing protein [Streptomyces sp. MAR4 CNX-425]|uniref:helix-turn-helix domain-containing protein n=1 Tax=Streptomyces sp. MAR4 CNX-425 TaxID=3406343 RepID=UPI003B502C58
MMDSAFASTSGGVARTVRAHREARGWSLGTLANRTGLSKTLLSTLESGAGNPSLETMWRLARAFDITLGTLLGEENLPQTRLLRAGDGPSMTSESGLAARLILAEGRSHRTEVYDVRVQPGTPYTSLHPPGTEELVYCTEGTLEAGPQGQEAELSPGDALWFPGDVTHRYFSHAGARVLSVMSYPPARYGGADDNPETDRTASQRGG